MKSTMKDKIKKDGFILTEDGKILVGVLDKKQNSYLIPDRAFINCKNLTGIVIPNSVTTIGEQAFYGCEKLTSIVIPDSVATIGEQAFYGCKKLTVTISEQTYEQLGIEGFYM